MRCLLCDYLRNKNLRFYYAAPFPFAYIIAAKNKESKETVAGGKRLQGIPGQKEGKNANKKKAKWQI